jgi:hypothetical protein
MTETWPKVAVEGNVKAVAKPKEILAFGSLVLKASWGVAG